MSEAGIMRSIAIVWLLYNASVPTWVWVTCAIVFTLDAAVDGGYRMVKKLGEK